jgi:hypothetical protein
MGGDGRTVRASRMAARRPWLVGSAVSLCLLASAPASAGAWTRPAGSGLTITTASHHAFALSNPDAGFSKIETAIFAEYGLTDRLTLVGRVARKHTFAALCAGSARAGATYSLSFNTVSQAWGELEAGMRLNALE